MSTSFPWLSAIILFPLAASLLIPVLPDKEGRTVRWYALSVGLIDFALTIYALWTQYDFTTSGYQFVETVSWIPQINLNWSLAIDGL